MFLASTHMGSTQWRSSIYAEPQHKLLFRVELEEEGVIFELHFGSVYVCTVEHAAKAYQVKALLRENFIVRMGNTFISILFLREESC